MTAQVARAAFPKGCLAIRVRDALGEVFEDAQFAGLFATRGRPAVSPARLALVSLLQFAEGLSDRQAADAVRGRIDWKYALGLELTDTGFDASVLSEFRARLAADDQAERLLQQMLARLRERGLLARGGRQRTDATHVLAAVRELNRLELVTETLRAALEALAAAAPAWLQEFMPEEWYARYGQRAVRALAMLGAAAGQIEIGRTVDHRATEEPDAGGGEPTPLVGLVHQLERQRRDEHAAAEGHDGGDQPLGQGGQVADGRADQQGRPGDQAPQPGLEDPWHDRYSGRLGKIATRRPPQCGQRVNPGAVAGAPLR
jgi:transposase